jgi:hypothetical protein
MKIIGIHGKSKSGKDEIAKILCYSYGCIHMSFADAVKEYGIKYFGLTKEACYETKTKESRLILQGIGNGVRQLLTNNTFLIKSTNHITNELVPNEDYLNNGDALGISGYPTWVEEIAMSEFGLLQKELKSRKKLVKIILEGIHSLIKEEYPLLLSVTYNKKESGDSIWIQLLLRKCDGFRYDDVIVISDVRYRNEKEFVDRNGICVKVVREDKPEIEIGETHQSEVNLDTLKDYEWFLIFKNMHKENWEELLIIQTSNLINKLKTNEFFSKRYMKEKFKITGDLYG